MANIKSAIKRIRQTAKHYDRNKDARTQMRTYCKRVLEAVDAGNTETAPKALVQAVSVLAISVRKGIIHRNRAARISRRLNIRVKNLVLTSAPA